ncbi:dihydropteroate synthase [soil metagenome]
MPDTEGPVWRTRTHSLPLVRPLIMGVVNVTPDSFSDGGLYVEARSAIDHGLGLVASGADLVDVGGESTRPGARPVDRDTEMRRVLPVVEALADAGIVVSVDTTKPEVAAAAMANGAEIINDVSAARADGMTEVVVQSGAGVVLMHMRGDPATMQDDPRYGDVVSEVRDHLVRRATELERAGVDRAAVVIDPGLGFGKTLDHNLELLRGLGEFVVTGYPVMIGASRKSFLSRLTGSGEPHDLDVATAAVTALGIARGASVLRVHDVGSSLLAARIAAAIARA